MTKLALPTFALVALLAGCTEPSLDESFSCTVTNLSGREDSSERSDPIARALAEGSCRPADEVLAEIAKESSCSIDTRLVSETARLGGNQTYRAVIAAHCSSDSFANVFVAPLLGITETSAARALDTAEIISFDSSAGVFNYYDVVGDSWRFFGSSHDLADEHSSRASDGAPERFVATERAARTHEIGGRSDEVRKCAACHVGGGPIMKELDSPWLHWEGVNFDEPSRPVHKALLSTLEAAQIEGFTRVGGGSDMQLDVEGAAKAWNQTRIDKLTREGRLRDLLRPLFCSTDLNLGTDDFQALEFGEPQTSRIFLRSDQLVDEALAGASSSIFSQLGLSQAVPSEDYQSLVAEAKQSIPGFPDKQDTFFRFAFVKRSFADRDHIAQLLEQGLSEELVADILSVDFTRPVFSDPRCQLLSLVPEESEAPIGLTSVHEELEAVIPELGDFSPAGRDLAAHLETPGTLLEADKRVEEFIEECEAKEPGELLEALFEVVLANRVSFREFALVESPALFPRATGDSTRELDVRLDPSNCDLAVGYISERK